MDSVTQIALGATVAEVMTGKQAGNKAILWGAVFGTLPDLDVTLNWVFDQVTMLGVHRGISHSIFFAFLTSPLFGIMLRKIHKNTEISSMKWSWMVFMVLITHVLLDAFTVYGTQLFAPFSNWAVGINSIFIIDPVYTLPMLLGILITLFIKNRNIKVRLNRITLIFSTFYLFLSLVFKIYTSNVMENNLASQGISHDKFITMATPLNIFLFSGMAIDDDKIYTGLYSIFDSDKNIKFDVVDRNSDLIKDQNNNRVIKKLLWFSKGFYQVRENKGDLYFSDMRFGRSDFWLLDEGSFVFDFKLVKDNNDNISTFERSTPSMDTRGELFSQFIDRVFGN